MFSLVFLTMYATRLIERCAGGCGQHGFLCRHPTVANLQLNDKGENERFVSGADAMNRRAVLFFPSLAVRARIQ
jgi:hypothetical protein